MKRLLISAIAVSVCTVAITYATVTTNHLRRENATRLHQAHEEAEARLLASRAETARLQAEYELLRRELVVVRQQVSTIAVQTLNRGSLLHYYPQPWWVQWLLAPFGSFRV